MSETLFEAAVLGLRALKRDGWMGEVGPATRLEVEVKEPTVTHVLSVQQIQRWLESTGKAKRADEESQVARLDAMSLRAVPIVRVFSSKTEGLVAYLPEKPSTGWK